uniref:hypothetical protein n=1 Tax=Lachnoclostridium phocaeense TaxID=1871021 RepID=UPI0026DCC96F|nr:hypothetical protein [Lachnoclostridium phocaeense]
MGKSYNQVSGEIAAIQRKTITMAFSPRFSFVSQNEFRELVEGKIRLSLYDFSNGKGDNATYVYFNLDLADFKYLFQCAKQMYLPQPYFQTKIYGKTKEVQGQYTGMCKSFRLSVTRNEIRSDQSRSMYPWSIQITNGYGRAKPGPVEGTFFEEKSSFVEVGKVSILLTDIEFLDRLEALNAYLDEYRHYAASKLLETGEAKIQELYERSSYQEDIAQGSQQAPYEDRTANGQQRSAAVPAAGTGQTVPAAAQAGSNTRQQSSQPILHATPMVLTQGFAALENNWCVTKCMIGGNEYTLFLQNNQVSDLTEARDRGVAVMANLYDYQGRLYYHSLAATN